MTNKQKIRELQDRVKRLEKENESNRNWLMEHSDFSLIIEESLKKNVSGLSKEQVQDLIYRLALLAYQIDCRKGNLSHCIAEIIKLITYKASEQNEQTESEETKNECNI